MSVRKFEFRAWDKREKRMGEVTEIRFSKSQYPCVNVRFKQNGKIIDERYCFGQEDGCDNVILMQYTGLKDKNGKEIYEGDILKDNKGKVYEIVWGHDLLWLAKTNEKQGNCYCPKGLVEHGAVVAGNRWDNPELLKEVE